MPRAVFENAAVFHVSSSHRRHERTRSHAPPPSAELFVKKARLCFQYFSAICNTSLWRSDPGNPHPPRAPLAPLAASTWIFGSYINPFYRYAHCVSLLLLFFWLLLLLFLFQFFFNPSDHIPVIRRVNRFGSVLINQSNQSIHQSINQSTNYCQSINQSINESIHPFIHSSVNPLIR